MHDQVVALGGEADAERRLRQARDRGEDVRVLEQLEGRHRPALGLLDLRFGDAGDARACLAEVAVLIDAIEGVLENKIAKAGTMISNGSEEMRSSLGKARASVARGRTPEIAAEPIEGVLRAVP